MLAIKIIVALFVVVMCVFGVVRNSIEGKNVEDEEYSFGDPDEGKKAFLKWQPIALIALVVVTVIIGAFSSIYFTSEQEIGFTSMFGKTSMIETPGMHFKVPFLSQKHIYDATTQGMPIGYSMDDNQSNEEDSLMITSDFNFVNIDFYIEYRISDPIEYHFGSNDPEGVLKNISQSAIRNTVGQYDVDSVMTTGKPEIETKVFEDIIQELTYHKTGLTVTNVTIQDSEPPTANVANAFKDVENAKQNAEIELNKAHEYEKTQIPAAEADAVAVKQSATAAKTERINEAKEEIAKFEALYEEYHHNPDTVKQRLYYEALEEILPNMKIIIGKDSKVIYINSDGSIEKKE